jgi:hypothetical protein
MSTEQGGTATWHTTITCLEDGETANEAALVTEMVVPIIDRTKYLYEEIGGAGSLLIPQAWALFTTDGVGGVTIVDGANVNSATITSNTVRLTLANTMASTDYAGIGNDAAGSKLVTCFPISTTVLAVQSVTPSTGVQENLATVARTILAVVFGRRA